MTVETTPEVYQVHAWIRQISPMIGRRLLVRTDSTLADLHDVLEIAERLKEGSRLGTDKIAR